MTGSSWVVVCRRIWSSWVMDVVAGDGVASSDSHHTMGDGREQLRSGGTLVALKYRTDDVGSACRDDADEKGR